MPIAFVFETSTEAAIAAGALAIRDKAFDPLTDDLLQDSAGDQVYTKGIDGIASDLKSAWLFFKGDYFLDLNKGVDYWGVIFTNASFEAKEEEFRREALDVPGVAGIDLILSKVSGRSLRVDAQVSTDTGLIFKVVLGVNAGQ